MISSYCSAFASDVTKSIYTRFRGQTTGRLKLIEILANYSFVAVFKLFGEQLPNNYEFHITGEQYQLFLDDLMEMIVPMCTKTVQKKQGEESLKMNYSYISIINNNTDNNHIMTLELSTAEERRLRRKILGKLPTVLSDGCYCAIFESFTEHAMIAGEWSDLLVTAFKYFVSSAPFAATEHNGKNGSVIQPKAIINSSPDRSKTNCLKLQILWNKVNKDLGIKEFNFKAQTLLQRNTRKNKEIAKPVYEVMVQYAKNDLKNGILRKLNERNIFVDELFLNKFLMPYEYGKKEILNYVLFCMRPPQQTSSKAEADAEEVEDNDEFRLSPLPLPSSSSSSSACLKKEEIIHSHSSFVQQPQKNGSNCDSNCNNNNISNMGTMSVGSSPVIKLLSDENNMCYGCCAHVPNSNNNNNNNNTNNNFNQCFSSHSISQNLQNMSNINPARSWSTSLNDLMPTFYGGSHSSNQYQSLTQLRFTPMNSINAHQPPLVHKTVGSPWTTTVGNNNIDNNRYNCGMTYNHSNINTNINDHHQNSMKVEVNNSCILPQSPTMMSCLTSTTADNNNDNNSSRSSGDFPLFTSTVPLFTSGGGGGGGSSNISSSVPLLFPFPQLLNSRHIMMDVAVNGTQPLLNTTTNNYNNMNPGFYDSNYWRNIYSGERDVVNLMMPANETSSNISYICNEMKGGNS